MHPSEEKEKIKIKMLPYLFRLIAKE